MVVFICVYWIFMVVWWGNQELRNIQCIYIYYIKISWDPTRWDVLASETATYSSHMASSTIEITGFGIQFSDVISLGWLGGLQYLKESLASLSSNFRSHEFHGLQWSGLRKTAPSYLGKSLVGLIHPCLWRKLLRSIVVDNSPGRTG